MTDEQQERLKQIRRWRMMHVSANSDPYVDLSRAFGEIDFLLSLHDSQAAWSKQWPNVNGGIYWRRYTGSYLGEPEICILNNGYLDSFSGKSTMSIPSEGLAEQWEFLGPISPNDTDVATAMRDACVEKVKEYLTDCRDEERGIIEAIVSELKSIKPDQVDLLARFQELFRESEAAASTKGENDGRRATD